AGLGPPPHRRRTRSSGEHGARLAATSAPGGDDAQPPAAGAGGELGLAELGSAGCRAGALGCSGHGGHRAVASGATAPATSGSGEPDRRGAMLTANTTRPLAGSAMADWMAVITKQEVPNGP